MEGVHLGWKITEMTHRVKLVFGFYHSKLPIEADISNKIVSESYPYYGLSNVFYLVSNVGKIVGTDTKATDKNKLDERRQITYKSIEFMRQNLPLICHKKGAWIKCGTNNFTNLEFTLCDFQMEPIIIHAPIHITLEVKLKPGKQTLSKYDGLLKVSKPLDIQS
jgi:hypothetical protein